MIYENFVTLEIIKGYAIVFVFLASHAAREIFISRPGNKPVSPAVEA